MRLIPQGDCPQKTFEYIATNGHLVKSVKEYKYSSKSTTIKPRDVVR